MPRIDFYPCPPQQAVDETVCQLIAWLYRQAEKLPLYVYTASAEHASSLDDALWLFEPTAFIPHGLTTQAITNKAVDNPCIQFGNTLAKTLTRPYTSLLNLTETVPADINAFRYIIELVPEDNIEKKKARARYRQYQQQNMQVKFHQQPTF